MIKIEPPFPGMSLSARFTIDLAETFPELPDAPSIEAVIYWQAHASKALTLTDLTNELTRRLPEYPIRQPQHNIEISASLEADGTSEVSQRTHQNGLRLQDEHHHVAQFTQTGVAFSRLEPYEQWESFKDEALKFWDIFLELAEPIAIQQLGVRYINRISLQDGETPETYLKQTPSAQAEIGLELGGLRKASFFYQDTYGVPGTPYSVSWVRTIQTQLREALTERALIIDINVFTTALVTPDRESLIQRLSEMRWIKNKLFFSCVTRKALQRLGG